MPVSKKITLLFNANKAYDRKIISGVARYLQQGVNWELFLEDDYLTHLEKIKYWQGDGVIADFDDPSIVDFVLEQNMKVVGVGGSFQDASKYPANVHYVATNNHTISKLAVEHFLSLGYQGMAFYGVPDRANNQWSIERENSFCQLVEELTAGQVKPNIYRGHLSSYRNWHKAMKRLQDWIISLPKPIAIMAATDNRARQLIDACRNLDIKVPEQVAILGVDDDDIVNVLTGNKLSSIRQGTEYMGYLAASILDKLLNDEEVEPLINLVEPIGVVQNASTDHLSVDDHVVKKAISYIKEHACDGIQATHVLRHLQLSRANVENRFREHLNSSIHQEIVKVQLANVKQMLLNTGLTLSDISEKTGYNTVQYMIMVFKKQTGLTPSQYRERFM
ncbi:XylR family transcriptional regulator [Catenovulum maritimum]|uniref:HTH araC/xylS-type domain-containing protein n=1 Tax=Catenovulum maritimum TaxID=1513271 RepID=A0A0J8GV95_9ALTE|nr:DNA-binding transcriptional regulator [Catenovulum maritimum]KMT64593.1 hypothetical protein XM47_13175 [Catenovulum maritimum]